MGDVDAGAANEHGVEDHEDRRLERVDHAIVGRGDVSAEVRDLRGRLTVVK